MFQNHNNCSFLTISVQSSYNFDCYLSLYIYKYMYMYVRRTWLWWEWRISCAFHLCWQWY